MGTRQRIIIFLVIGVFVVSTLGFAIFALTDSNSASSEDVATETAEQARLIAEQQEAFQAQQERSNTCRSATPTVTLDAPDLPDFELPKGDVTELSSVDLKEGTGDSPSATDCVVAYYHGVLADGTVFDSAYERGEPSNFLLDGVIQGWTVGFDGLKEGGVRVLTIPSELAYGETGRQPLIQPNADLIFVVQLVEIVEI